MSNFRQKLKKLLESSFYENKKIDNIYHQKNNRSNNKFNSKIIYNKNIKHLFIPERNKTKNNSFIYGVNNYKSKEKEQLSLYKRYKKYNNILDKPNKNICTNILDNYKNNENSKTQQIFDYSLSSKMIIRNKRLSNSTSTNHLTVDNFFNKNNDKSIENNYNNKNKINFRNKNYLEYQMNNIKRKNSSNRVENKIIQKIELIENENKEKKIKNLLINKSPIVFINSIYKSSNYNYTYHTSKSKIENKNKYKNNKKNKNFLDLDDLKDIISSIKNQKYTIIKSKEFNDLNK